MTAIARHPAIPSAAGPRRVESRPFLITDHFRWIYKEAPPHLVGRRPVRFGQDSAPGIARPATAPDDGRRTELAAGPGGAR